MDIKHRDVSESAFFGRIELCSLDNDSVGRKINSPGKCGGAYKNTYLTVAEGFFRYLMDLPRKSRMMDKHSALEEFSQLS